MPAMGSLPGFVAECSFAAGTAGPSWKASLASSGVVSNRVFATARARIAGASPTVKNTNAIVFNLVHIMV